MLVGLLWVATISDPISLDEEWSTLNIIKKWNWCIVDVWIKDMEIISCGEDPSSPYDIQDRWQQGWLMLECKDLAQKWMILHWQCQLGQHVDRERGVLVSKMWRRIVAIASITAVLALCLLSRSPSLIVQVCCYLKPKPHVNWHCYPWASITPQVLKTCLHSYQGRQTEDWQSTMGLSLEIRSFTPIFDLFILTFCESEYH